MTDDLNFPCELIMEKNFSEYQTDPSAFEKVLQKNLSAIRKTHPEIYLKIKDFYDWITDFAAYREQLINKNITVLAGRNRTGKTSFFNTVFGKPIFPPGLNGSIPVYCAFKEHKKTKAVTAFERLVSLDEESFFRLFPDNSEAENGASFVSEKLFKSIMTFSEATGLKHITFLDLGGYRKTSDKDFSDDSSSDIMIERINRCSSLIWFADIDPNSLSISDDDIEILKTVRSDIPKIIIISKADIYPAAAFNEIFEKTKKILFARKIKNLDVLSYSGVQPEKFDKYKILAYLDRWDHQTERLNITEMFSSLFSYSEDETACGKNLSDILPELELLSDTLYKVPNAFQTDIENKGFIPVDSSQTEPVPKSKQQVNHQEFLRSKAGSQISANPEKLFRNYNSSITENMTSYEQYTDSVSAIIMECMNNITPVISDNKNSTDYKKDITGIISEYFRVISEHKTADSDSAKLAEGAGDDSDRSSSRRSRRNRSDNEQQKSGSLFKRDKNK